MGRYDEGSFLLPPGFSVGKMKACLNLLGIIPISNDFLQKSVIGYHNESMQLRSDIPGIPSGPQLILHSILDMECLVSNSEKYISDIFIILPNIFSLESSKQI